MDEPQRVEGTGPDIEAAIANGLAKLGLTRKTARFIVDETMEPNRGLFGLGKREAHVKLTVYAIIKPPEPKQEAPAPPPAPAREQPQPRPRQEESAPSRSSGRNQQPRQAPRQQQPRPPRQKSPHRDEDEAGLPELKQHAPAADDDEARVSLETLQELLAKMRIDANVASYYVDAADDNEQGPLVLQVTGRDLGILIGRRGETLAALQYITRLIVSRELQKRVNLVVDVERYKQRREQRLYKLALSMAKQAANQKRTVKLEPMPAYERRIVHLALRDRTDVYTESEGEGDSRRVTIIPVQDR
ncbi:MAG: KH domain-containing protein [Anaerolineae bacterium]|nr:KH domain-containing protein [Anaerolineae bacterium]